MAVTDHQPPIQFGWVDPTEEEPVAELKVQYSNRTPIDPAKVEVIYDRPSDTLVALLYGTDRRSVVVSGPEPYQFLADPDTGEFLGFQIEDYFSFAAKEQPRLLEAVEVARLRGITREEVHRKRRNILEQLGMRAAWVRGKPRHRLGHGRYVVVRDLFRDDSLGLPREARAAFAG